MHGKELRDSDVKIDVVDDPPTITFEISCSKSGVSVEIVMRKTFYGPILSLGIRAGDTALFSGTTEVLGEVPSKDDVMQIVSQLGVRRAVQLMVLLLRRELNTILRGVSDVLLKYLDQRIDSLELLLEILGFATTRQRTRNNKKL